MSYPGIDYSNGANIDTDTGIHYGVIPVIDVIQAWDESSEAVYNDPICPECQADLVDSRFLGGEDDDEEENWVEKDWCCESCEKSFWSDEVFPDTPSGWKLQEEGYDAFQEGDDTDIFITMSPYYTYAQYCSPCAPGAGHLGSPLRLEDGETLEQYEARALAEGWPKTYCFGDDWFDGGKAPYPVFKVKI